MQWFQYRPGVVVESLRVAHRAAPTSETGAVDSWCRRKFHVENVEETSNPTGPPQPGMATPCPPCSQCVLIFLAASDAAHDRNRDTPATADDRTLAGFLRKAQWLLDDAAHYLPEGRCSAEDCELLAKTLDQLATAVREHAARCVVIEQSDHRSGGSSK
jgi:hypothetical protein